MKKVFYSSLFVSTALLSACTSKLSTVSPQSTDLSGHWVLNTTYSEDVVMPSANRRGNGERGKGGGRGGRGEGFAGGRGGNGGGKRSQGQPPEQGGRGRKPEKTLAMTAKEIIITQNSDSMGIAYTGQTYRDVDWGKTKMWDRTIEAGWDNENQLVIETSYEKRDISETYQLNSGGRVLTLIIDVNGNERGGEYRRVFERKELTKN